MPLRVGLPLTPEALWSWSPPSQWPLPVPSSVPNKSPRGFLTLPPKEAGCASPDPPQLWSDGPGCPDVMGEIEGISVVRDSTETVLIGVAVVLKADEASRVVSLVLAVCVEAAVEDSPMELD